MITDPEVLVLDEPTSAVDSHTEARIADGVREVRTGRTTVVFTSSPLLLDHADRVVLVHEGKAVAVGTHRDLLRGEPRYRAVVTRETEDESASRDTPDKDDSASRNALDKDDSASRNALDKDDSASRDTPDSEQGPLQGELDHHGAPLRGASGDGDAPLRGALRDGEAPHRGVSGNGEDPLRGASDNGEAPLRGASGDGNDLDDEAALRSALEEIEESA